jgi:hypothetical protein
MAFQERLDMALGDPNEKLWGQFAEWVGSIGRRDIQSGLVDYTTFDDFVDSDSSVEFLNFTTDLWNKWLDLRR